MPITAAMVKELRERTGAGMMECKKALIESNGDITAAVEHLRKKGAASADKKSSRIAAEGIIVIRQSDDSKTACIVEINCETDFVTKDELFQSFAVQVADLILKKQPENLATERFENGKTVQEARRELIAKIGENISIRRHELVSAFDNEIVADYLHGSRIGVLVSVTGDKRVGRDVAMHIAASRPLCISVDQLPTDVIEKEKVIFKAQAEESGKPADIIDKIIAGRMQKFMKENTLLGQSFVKDPDLSVEKYLSQNSSTISHMVRYEVGEGIEKRKDDFATQVMAAAKGG